LPGARHSCFWGSAKGAGSEKAEGAFLLEVQCPRPAEAAGSLTQIGHRGADGRFGENAQPERESRRADIEAPLEREARGHGVHVALGELPVAPLPRLDGRQQAKGFPVAKHSR
jgi:hypothetical protein